MCQAWLQAFQPGTYLDMRQERITYSDFVNQVCSSKPTSLTSRTSEFAS